MLLKDMCIIYLHFDPFDIYRYINHSGFFVVFFLLIQLKVIAAHDLQEAGVPGTFVCCKYVFYKRHEKIVTLFEMALALSLNSYKILCAIVPRGQTGKALL